MKNLRKIIVTTVAIVMVLACQAYAEDAQSDKVLATVGKEKITEADLAARISMLPPQFRARYETPDGRQKLLDQTIKFSLLAQEARAQGVEQQPEVAQKIKEITDNIMIQELTRKEISEKVVISDQEIEKYYTENKNEFIKPEKVKVNLIMFEVKEEDSKEVKAQKEQQARETLEKIKAGANFEELAKELSDDKRTKKRGGSTGYFSRDNRKNTYGEKFEEAAFSLKENELSDVIEDKKGFYIIKFDDKKPQEEQTLEEVKQRIERKLSQQKQKDAYEAFVEGLKKKYPVTMMETAGGTAPAQSGQ